MTLVFDPYIPLALWMPLAAAAAALWCVYAMASRRRLTAARRRIVLALMAAALVVPLAVLLNPTWLERIPPPPGKPVLNVLVDRSASMATADAANGESRYAAAGKIAAAMSSLDDRYEVRIREFAGESVATSIESLRKALPDGAITDLAKALDESLDDRQPQGQAVLLLSDGGHNAEGGSRRLRESLAKAKGLAAPIYSVPLGGASQVRDLEVNLSLPQEVAFVDQRVHVAVGLRQRGSLATNATLVLSLDGKELERRQTTLKPDAATEEIFYVTQKDAGLYRYEVRAEPLAGEVTPLNNTATLLLRVIDQPIRVLLLEGKPYWDTKFLVRTLANDPSVQLTSVVQITPGRLLRRTVASPTTEKDTPTAGKSAPKAVAKPNEQWAIEQDAAKFLADANTLAEYQIVVLGRNADAFLGDEAVARLKKWLVENDGSLVCFRGAPSARIGQRLGELMPVEWTPSVESRFRAQWTVQGQSLHWLPTGPTEDLSGMPSLGTVSQPKLKPAAAVALAASEKDAAGSVPLIAYRPLGGRVVTIEGAGMWRWAFLPPQYQQRDDVYSSLWRSLIRWLASDVGLLPSQRMALRTDRVSFRNDEPVTASLLVREDQLSGQSPQLELSSEAMKSPRAVSCVPQGTAPGHFYASLGRLPEGRYWLRVAGAPKEELSATTTFDVRGDLQEQLDVAARRDVLELVASQSGGAILEQADAPALAKKFDADLARNRPDRFARTTAWDRWWVLLGSLALWGTAWGVRRWSGLV